MLKEDKEFAINGKQKGSVREETSVVSGTTGIRVQNRHQKPLHPLSHQHEEGEVRREKKNLRGRSPSGKFDRQPCKNFLKGICTESPCDNWHPPECHFYKSESGCNFGDKCSFAHRQVEGQPCKMPKKDGDTGAVGRQNSSMRFCTRDQRKSPIACSLEPCADVHMRILSQLDRDTRRKHQHLLV